VVHCRSALLCCKRCYVIMRAETLCQVPLVCCRSVMAVLHSCTAGATSCIAVLWGLQKERCCAKHANGNAIWCYKGAKRSMVVLQVCAKPLVSWPVCYLAINGWQRLCMAALLLTMQVGLFLEPHWGRFRAAGGKEAGAEGERVIAALLMIIIMAPVLQPLAVWLISWAQHAKRRATAPASRKPRSSRATSKVCGSITFFVLYHASRQAFKL
jgi:hypothetical protein